MKNIQNMVILIYDYSQEWKVYLQLAQKENLVKKKLMN